MFYHYLSTYNIKLIFDREFSLHDILKVEGNVEQCQKCVDKFERYQFGNDMSLKLFLGSMIFFFSQPMSQV